MKRGAVVFLAILLILSLTVSAENTVLLHEALSNKRIDSARVHILIENHDGTNTSLQAISDSEGRIIFNTDFSFRKIIVRADELDTQGKDYFGVLMPEEDKDVIYLFPVGSVEGIVLDSLDNVIPKAELKFSCSADMGEDWPDSTDKYGSFKYEYAPVGYCKVYTYFNKGVGIQEFYVSKGNITDISVKLDRTIVPNSVIKNRRSPTSFILLIFVSLLVAFGVIYFTVRKKPDEQLSKRTKDILKTLNKKEKEVVMYLIDNKECRSQSKLSYEIKIPKTTLYRIIEKLQDKNIIDCNKKGKYKRISPTEWFLGDKR
ncbi:MAG: hypothetical protein MAG795_00084 [Candidatus Woesearchaeota archaeon]|nr:hypothetical protein [Candidatus Woesearchaeota archaeon]